jgi:hypothetical protein
MRALRYPDRSIVIDLSRVSQDDKVRYIRSALPTLNVMRRHLGLPHRIVLDEAHYFLHDGDAGQLLDLDRNGYTVISFCASRLPRALLDATEVMIVTCESNPAELEALRRQCECSAPVDAADWEHVRHLRPGQAAILPISEESQGRLQLLTVARRLTPHVRHREKYVDVPVSAAKAFVAGAPGSPQRLQTLRQFVNYLEQAPPAAIEPYLRRGDFSRWIKDVFGDFSLAAELRVLEAQPIGPDTTADMGDAVRSRYDLADELVQT